MFNPIVPKSKAIDSGNVIKKFLSKHAYLSIAAAITFGLIGCTPLPLYHTIYKYVPPTSLSGRTCVTQCSKEKDICQFRCDEKGRECHGVAGQETSFQYQSYILSRELRNLPLELNKQDFYQDWACQVPCDCNYRYDQCFSTCGGQILIEQKCIAFCGPQHESFKAS